MYLYLLPLYWFTLSPGSLYAPLLDSEALLRGDLPLHWAALLAGNIPALPPLLLHHGAADLLVERPADLLQDGPAVAALSRPCVLLQGTRVDVEAGSDIARDSRSLVVAQTNTGSDIAGDTNSRPFVVDQSYPTSKICR